MGILDKIVGKKDKEKVNDPYALPEDFDAVALCPHTVMVPRWDRAEDLGHAEKATVYVCEACGTIMSPDEVRVMEAGQAERLKEITAIGTSEAEPQQ